MQSGEAEKAKRNSPMLEKRADVGKVWVSKGQATRHNTRVHHAALESDSAGRHPPGGGGWGPGEQRGRPAGLEAGAGVAVAGPPPLSPEPAATPSMWRREAPADAEAGGGRTGGEGRPARRGKQQARSGGGRGVRLPGACRSHRTFPPCLPPGEPRASPTGLTPPPPPLPRAQRRDC